MRFEEAVNDKSRPLSITPREWMMSVEASLAEEEELTEKAVNRIAGKDKKDEQSTSSGDGVEKIDIGVDQIIQGIKICYAGLSEAERANLPPELRKIINKVKDLMDTAISPYMLDVIDALDKMDN